VILDFQVDEKVLAEDRQQDPTVADPAVIETTYFVMPVRFAVDARELLQTPSSAWLPQPVLGFATHLALSVGALRSTGTASCSVAGAGTLRFQQRGERVHLICSFNKIEVETPTTDLVVAVAHFRRRVEEVLRTRVPELATHSSWPSWFPES
jgi:hypothetical protein